MSQHRVLRGDALSILRRLPSGIADCCVTSPPYWGLRDYGVSGQLGLESTPAEYVDRLVSVFREVRRVLKPGRTLWLVLGDTYFTAGGRCENPGGDAHDGHPRGLPPNRASSVAGLKPKDLAGIPWRVALTLQQDGWWLRNAVTWAKPNGLPTSVKDRFSCRHEYVFLFANAERYHFDLDAVREPFAASTFRRALQSGVLHQAGGPKQRDLDAARPEWRRGQRSSREIVKSVARRLKTAEGDTGGGARLPPEPGERGAFHPLGKNPGDVWSIPTAPSRLPHFASFPPALVRKPILAGCPQGGLVLDPFCGVGTTLLVAKELGRRSLGIDLHPKYVAIARKRLAEGGRRAA